MKTLKEIIIGFLIGSIIAQPLAVMAETREQYIDHTKNTYNPAADQRATNLQGTVQNKIVNTWAGRNPEVFYGGNSLGGVLQADLSDLGRIASRFFSCVNFSWSWRWRFTWRRGLQWKFRMSYRYPIQKIHTHHYKQNRYLPSGFYSILNPSPIYQSVIYPLINLQTQARVLRADMFSKGELVRHVHIPHIGAPTIGNYPANYTGFSNRKFREQSGMLNSTSLQEYHVGPTGFNEIFIVLKLLIPYLRALLEITRCHPPNRIPYHLTSDSFLTLLTTRVAWPFLVTAKDDFLNGDYSKYLQNPGMCTRFQLNYGEIPQDMYDNVAPTLNLVPQIYPELMNPNDLRDQNFSDFRRICHRKLGTIFPYTTNETAGTHDIVTAQVSVIKALRWAFGIYLTTMHQGNFPKTGSDYVTSNPRNWDAQQDGEPGYYNLDLTNDRIQRLYPTSTSCQTFGNIAPKFAGANTQKTAGKDGVYSFAHWKYFSCESGWRAPVMPSPW